MDLYRRAHPSLSVPRCNRATLDGRVRRVDERLVLGARYARVTPRAINRADLNVAGDLTILETTNAGALNSTHFHFSIGRGPTFKVRDQASGAMCGDGLGQSGDNAPNGKKRRQPSGLSSGRSERI